MNAMTVSPSWDRCHQAFSEQLATDDYEKWIKPIRALEVDGVLVIYAPNAFIKDVIQNDYLAVIRELVDDSLQIKVAVGDPPKAKPARSEGPSPTPPQAAGGEPSTRAPAAPRRAPRNVPVAPVDGVLQDPWPDELRGLSSDLARSAFFTANRYGIGVKRPMRDGTLLFSQRNIKIWVTGEEVNAFDELVLTQLIHYQRRLPFGQPVYFCLSDLARWLGLATSGFSLKKVEESIRRLNKCHIDLSYADGSKVFRGVLINTYEMDLTQPQHFRHKVTFSQRVVDLFSAHNVSLVDWEQRLQLRIELAQKVHSFLSTHRSPFPMGVPFYRGISGTENNLKTLKDFRRKLREALNELVRVGFLTEWKIDQDDKVHVVRAERKRIERS